VRAEGGALRRATRAHTLSLCRPLACARTLVSLIPQVVHVSGFLGREKNEENIATNIRKRAYCWRRRQGVAVERDGHMCALAWVRGCVDARARGRESDRDRDRDRLIDRE
jgi:hypothetical protein